MLISGTEMGDELGEGACYLGLFAHNLPNQLTRPDLIYVGNLFLDRYYLVYDMSPLE